MTYKITALKVQKRNPQRVNVFLDEEFAFGLSRIVAAWLTLGQELTDEEIAALKAKETYEVAFQQALKLLSYRQRSTSEVRRNLEEHGFGEGVILETLERLQRSGLIDDGRFAQNWVDNRNEFRPRSRRALYVELRQRGLDDADIEQALEDIDDDELAYQAASRRASRWAGSEWPEFQQKMTAFLARRGFHYGAISTAVRRVWNEHQDDSSAGGFTNEIES
jgi:regulatory protein